MIRTLLLDASPRVNPSPNFDKWISQYGLEPQPILGFGVCLVNLITLLATRNFRIDEAPGQCEPVVPGIMSPIGFPELTADRGRN
jgi:hypothetical protein